MTEQTIEVTVVKRLWPKADDAGDIGWQIIRTDGGVAKGSLPWAVQPGEPLRLTGHYEPDKFSGGQTFVFTSGERNLPVSPRAMLAYAVSITSGLGPASEAEIWTRWGEAWQTDADLAQVAGLRSATREAWTETLWRIEHEQQQSRTLGWAIEHGLTTSQAGKAWEAWGAAVVGVLTADPYRLTDLPGIGWPTADRWATEHFGMLRDDRRRLQSAAVHAVRTVVDATGGTLAGWLAVCLEAQALVGAVDVDELLADAPAVVRHGSDYALANDYAADRAIAAYYGGAA